MKSIEIKKAVHNLMTDGSRPTTLDHENYKNDYVRKEQRSGRGQYILEAPIEELVEQYGYSPHEAANTLVLEAVRVGANFLHRGAKK